MDVRPFRIEQYYAVHEFTAKFMLSSSDPESWSLRELLSLEPGAEAAFFDQRFGYTESAGAPALREAVAALYTTVTPEDVLICSSAEEAIFVLYHSLLRAGDRAIVESPGYESALELARSTGAEVLPWERRWSDGWRHDLEALRRSAGSRTRLLYVNTPHNPTGTLMAHDTLDEVVAIARKSGAVLFCDEVYRELEHDPAARLPAACDLDEHAVSLGSMSKAYGLPGLRLGWLVTRDPEIRQAALEFKHYTSICASAPSEFLSALALRHREVLLTRNRDLVRRNLVLLGAFMERRKSLFQWIRPTASPIGFPRLMGGERASAFCERLVRETGVLLLPGDVFDQPEHLRIGFGRANMPEALARLDDWLG